ncbi:hypothetical protein SUGI_1179230 [Cryptomeria japonica]|nr:hypothetical protein SUGI_1179230 [Cryptomeria japonica]
MEVEEWASILGPYFNPGCILSEIEVSDSEDEEQMEAVELQKKQENFMAEAWEVFRVGVTNGTFTPFRRMMEDNLVWLSDNSIDKVVDIGVRVSTIIRLI